MTLFKKFVTCIMALPFHSPVSHLSIYSATSPALFTKGNKPWNERKEDYLHI